MPAVEVSVIIPFHGDPGILQQVLEALSRQDTARRYESILVDSTPGQLGKAAAENHGILYVHAEQKLAPGRARNTGLKRAQGRYLAFLDADCIPCGDWIETIASALDQHPGHAVGGSVERHVDSLMARAAHLAEFTGYSCRDKPRLLRTAGSGNLAVCRKTAGDLTFPEDLDTCEDVVYCRRLRERGLKLHFEPRAVVRHRSQPCLSLFLQHQFRQGLGSGMARRRYPVKGSRAARLTLLLPLLPVFLAGKALCRTARAGNLRFQDLLTAWPLVFLGKCWYSWGFARGRAAKGSNL